MDSVSAELVKTRPNGDKHLPPKQAVMCVYVCVFLDDKYKAV